MCLGFFAVGGPRFARSLLSNNGPNNGSATRRLRHAHAMKRRNLRRSGAFTGQYGHVSRDCTCLETR